MMRPNRRHAVSALLLFVALGPVLCAQQSAPRIGYAYPAGGQRGTTFQVVIGGQRLSGLNEVSVSGEGVQAVLLDGMRSLSQEEFREYVGLKERIAAFEARKAAAEKAGKTAVAGAGPEGAVWTPADSKLLAEAKQKVAALVKKPAGAIRKQPTPALAEILTAQVTVAADAEPGTREIRVAGPSGVSNPLVFCIGLAPEFSENASETITVTRSVIEKSRERPQTSNPKTEMTIALPATINGQVLPGEVNRYRFAAKKGQRLVIAVSARQLIPYISDAVPGWFQAAVALYGPDGGQLAYADSFRFSPDPVLHHEVAADGEYVVTIRDSLYRGREDFVYRITLGELPFVTGIFPLGGRAGAQTSVETRGWNLPDSRLSVEGADREPGIHRICVRKDGHVSNFVPFAVDTLPELAEEEREDARRITPPVIINGRIEPPEDTDVFCFDGRAGETIVAEVMARRLDSPLDSVLRLTDASGRELAYNDDHTDRGAGLTTHQADSHLQATLPADGTYCIHLDDAQHQGGPEHAYRLRIGPPRPDFELRVVPSSISARAGKAVPFTVHALRKDGFSGDIALSLKDAPESFKLGASVMPSTQAVARVTLAVQPTPETIPASIRIEGRAMIDGREVRHAAIPAEDMMQAFEYRHLVPAEELKLVTTGNMKIKPGPPRILGSLPVKIPAGGIAVVRVMGSAFAFSGKGRFEIVKSPAGIAIKSAAPAPGGGEIVFEADAAKVRPGQKGSLSVVAFDGPSVPTKGAGARSDRPASFKFPVIPFVVTKQ